MIAAINRPDEPDDLDGDGGGGGSDFDDDLDDLANDPSELVLGDGNSQLRLRINPDDDSVELVIWDDITKKTFEIHDREIMLRLANWFELAADFLWMPGDDE